MDYRESLDYLYGLQRFGIKLGLENIRALLERTGRPDLAFGAVHVAGTNGKGSVCACLAEILHKAGVRTGLYTSPHLHSFTERIRVGGIAVDEARVALLTDEIRSRTQGIPATFFEFTTALALLHFQRSGVEIAVLETGMGGRLDATNAVTPRVSVITPVSRDHAEHLGDSLTAIAGEKAGIVKEGIPLAIGPQPPEALEVLLAAAEEKRAPVHLLGRDFHVVPAGEGTFSFAGFGMRLEGLKAGLAGRHQFDNLALALAAACVLRSQGTALAEEALRGGVSGVRWPGRLEWWGGETVLLDGAHNAGGALVLADYLKTLPVSGIHWVAGIKGDKSPDDILGPILPRVRAVYAAPPPVEKAVSPETLAQAAREAGVPASVHPDAESALRAALSARGAREIVLVAGSLFLVAAAREALERFAEGTA